MSLSHHEISSLIDTIDRILAILQWVRGACPDRYPDLTARINSALDERLRLMRLRDGQRSLVAA
jgi:hypothetical protein